MDYTCSRWRHKRKHILNRDEGMCRNCIRYGKVRDATTVHHVWPTEEYPEYQWADWNLVSLCSKCHNEMHIRGSKRLSPLGERWRRKTPPPPPEA